MLPIGGAIRQVTAIIGSPTITGLQTTANTTSVTFSADVTFFFTINPVRR